MIWKVWLKESAETISCTPYLGLKNFNKHVIPIYVIHTDMFTKQNVLSRVSRVLWLSCKKGFHQLTAPWLLKRTGVKPCFNQFIDF